MAGTKTAGKKNILFLRPFLDHSVAPDMIKGLDTDNYNISMLNYDEKPNQVDSEDVASKIAFSYDSAVSENLGSNSHKLTFDNPRKQINQLLRLDTAHNFDLIIPTKERYVQLLSQYKHILGDKVFVPDLPVVSLLNDKAASYEFFNGPFSGIIVPDYAALQGCDLPYMAKLLEEKGARFVKPATASGGSKTSLVTSLDDFFETYRDNHSKLIASEVLHRPEFNHTVVVKNGEPVVQATYQSLSDAARASSKNLTVVDPKIARYAERFVEGLQSRFGAKAVDGMYNLDFLLNDGGEFVFSEANVGRLPGGNYVFALAGDSLADAAVQTALGNVPTKPLAYQPNIVHDRVANTVAEYVKPTPMLKTA